jgi:hypothetical protein
MLVKAAEAIYDSFEGPGKDVFDRFRVSNPFTVFDSKEITRSNPNLWDESVSGGASITFNTNQASHSLTLGTASGDKATRQTLQRMIYEPGHGQLILMTGVIGSGKSNVESRIGLFDDDNGLFFENKNGTMQVVRRTKTSGSVVDNEIVYTDWYDSLDGKGPSKVVVDWDKAQIFWVDFAWLGTGLVRFGLVIDGDFVVAHKITNANVLDKVYISDPNLPIRYEIENTGTAASGTSLTQICASVQSEGGYDPEGITWSQHTGDSVVGTVSAGTLTPLLSLRVDPNDVGSTELEPHAWSISSTGAGDYRVEVIVDGDLASASWSDVSTRSASEYDTSATTITGGIRIYSQYISGQSGQSAQAGGQQLVQKLKLGSLIDGTPERVTLAIFPITDTDVTGATMTWHELN